METSVICVDVVCDYSYDWAYERSTIELCV